LAQKGAFSEFLIEHLQENQSDDELLEDEENISNEIFEKVIKQNESFSNGSIEGIS
jgi:hypothetical protein